MYSFSREGKRALTRALHTSTKCLKAGNGLLSAGKKFHFREKNRSAGNKRSAHIFSAATATVGIAALLYSQQRIQNDSKNKNKQKKEEEVVRIVPVAEFIKHNKPDDCWIAIDGEVYDFSDFIPNHPGGKTPLIDYAGYDASGLFHLIHPKDTLQNYLPPDKHIGRLNGEAPAHPVTNIHEVQRRLYLKNLPPLCHLQNLDDFEYLAQKILPTQAWAYYSCGAGDEITMRENHYAFQRIFFRPKVCVDVSDVDSSTTLLGTKTEVPFYISATARARMGHPDGELALARGAGKEGVIQMISTRSSYSLAEIAKARPKGATQWFQLYVNEDHEVMKKMIREAEDLGMKALFVTVDAPVVNKREKNIRAKQQAFGATTRDSGQPTVFTDSTLEWNDIRNIVNFTKLPVMLKGVQRTEDIVHAADAGCRGVVLSNHGGRELDFSPPPIQVLAESVPLINRMEGVHPGFEIFLDGGVRRGADILKAVALGDGKVKVGVGIGRPFLYANSAYGEDGVRKCIQILKNEIETDMRLLGVTKMSQLNANFVDTRRLLGYNATDLLYDNLYQPMQPIKFKNELRQARKAAQKAK